MSEASDTSKADAPMIALGPITRVGGRVVLVMGDDIDTDRIIPARFLKRVTFGGLGELLFNDERHDEEGAEKAHPLNGADAAGARVLVTGRNFGCGSSREHAPQALVRAGLRAVVGESFAEIFFGNAITLGLVCVTSNRSDLDRLAELREVDAAMEVTIDVAGQSLEVKTGGEVLRFAAEMPAAAREALLSGQWDPLEQLLSRPDEVRNVARRLPYLTW